MNDDGMDNIYMVGIGMDIIYTILFKYNICICRGGWMFSVLLVKMLGCGAAAGAWRRGAATVTAAAALSLSGAGGPPGRDAVTLLTQQ